MLCLLRLLCLQLIFADEDMFIDVGSIVVCGALRAGGPKCRLASRRTLTFRSVPGIDPFDMVGGCCGGRWAVGAGCAGWWLPGAQQTALPGRQLPALPALALSQLPCV